MLQNKTTETNTHTHDREKKIERNKHKTVI